MDDIELECFDLLRELGVLPPQALDPSPVIDDHQPATASAAVSAVQQEEEQERRKVEDWLSGPGTTETDPLSVISTPSRPSTAASERPQTSPRSGPWTRVPSGAANAGAFVPPPFVSPRQGPCLSFPRPDLSFFCQAP
ncbi:hypothetical protein BDY24DRAFT_184187 [Mrakia frigida]|uniref:uncharacterized protein n=1 Tax=Mrakia frigida TaxID=29902 RepID=UPI003FCC176F